MQVDKATAVSLRQGATTYYFCCAGCRDRFAKLAAQPVVTVQSVDAQQAYTCPMHPEVEQVGPGTCPKCGMDLEPRMAGLQEDDGAESDMVSFDRRHNEANGHGNTDGPNDFCWTGTCSMTCTNCSGTSNFVICLECRSRRCRQSATMVPTSAKPTSAVR